MSRPAMLPGFAVRVFDVLVNVCGAHESDRNSFVHEFERRTSGPTTEWRFGGSFGFGGKFRYPRFTVDAYPENMTEVIEQKTVEANAQLARIKNEMLRLGWSEFAQQS